MKIIRNWVCLIIVLIGIAVALFITGKQHSVFLNNKKENGYSLIEVSYSIDGSKFKKLKPKKKAMVNVKGSTHKINLKFKDTTGNETVLEKEFKISPLNNVEISIPALLNDDTNWIAKTEQR